MTPGALRAGFIQKLTGAKSPSASLFLANLQNTTDAATHVAAASTFLAACTARPLADLTDDVVTRASQLRKLVKSVHSMGGGQAGQGIIEFAETLPVDTLPDDDKTFNPTTCRLE
jgi:hypothetical protein